VCKRQVLSGKRVPPDREDTSQHPLFRVVLVLVVVLLFIVLLLPVLLLLLLLSSLSCLHRNCRAIVLVSATSSLSCSSSLHCVGYYCTTARNTCLPLVRTAPTTTTHFVTPYLVALFLTSSLHLPTRLCIRVCLCVRACVYVYLCDRGHFQQYQQQAQPALCFESIAITIASLLHCSLSRARASVPLPDSCSKQFVVNLVD
jgi:hypothetical protein